MTSESMTELFQEFVHNLPVTNVHVFLLVSRPRIQNWSIKLGIRVDERVALLTNCPRTFFLVNKKKV